MPSGEVFTGPVETSANGRVRFTIRSSPAGVDVDGVELDVHGRRGRRGARAEVGEDYLQQALAIDAGARRLGEIGIGTNFGITRPIGAILFDEKIGGTRPPRARPLLPRDARQEQQRAALGPDLRSACGRAAQRRRRDDRRGRQVRARRGRRLTAGACSVQTMHPFRAAVEARDHEAMVATLAPDCKLYSPVAFKPFDGREAVAELFWNLLEVFEDFALRRRARGR